jgi:hypothetical protein
MSLSVMSHICAHKSKFAITICDFLLAYSNHEYKCKTNPSAPAPRRTLMTQEVAAYLAALAEWHANEVKRVTRAGTVSAQGDPGSSPPPPPPPPEFGGD